MGPPSSSHAPVRARGQSVRLTTDDYSQSSVRQRACSAFARAKKQLWPGTPLAELADETIELLLCAATIRFWLADEERLSQELSQEQPTIADRWWRRAIASASRNAHSQKAHYLGSCFRNGVSEILGLCPRNDCYEVWGTLYRQAFPTAREALAELRAQWLQEQSQEPPTPEATKQMTHMEFKQALDASVTPRLRAVLESISSHMEEGKGQTEVKR